MTTRTPQTNTHTQNSAHILLVDDCDVNRMVAQQHLEHAGYQVDTAASGRQAVEAYTRKSYDIVLMDIVMPDMDGYEAGRRMRKAEGGMRNKNEKNSDLKSAIHSVPIIAMSGLVTDEVAAECRAAGMNDCVGKPLQREELVMMVQKWTDSQSKFQNSPKPPKATSMNARTPIDDRAPIELEKTIAEFMGKTVILRDVINTFRERVKTQMVSIRQHFSDKDYRQIFLKAHSIKGGAANLRAFKLSYTAAQLENAAIEEAREETVARIDELEHEFDRFNRYLQKTGLPQLNRKIQPGSESFEERNEDSYR